MEEEKGKVFFNPEPKHWGPGTWFTIHSTAIDCNSKDKYVHFYFLIDTLSSKIPCSKCRKHFKKHCETFNPKEATPEYFNGRDITLFKWSFEFHNQVNSFLKKPVVGFGTSLEYYLRLESESLCAIGDCDDSGKKHNVPKKKEGSNGSLLASLLKSRHN